MIWCVDFSHPSFGFKVRCVTVEADSAKQAKEKANEVANEVLNWPTDVVNENAALVYHDYFHGICDIPETE